MPPGLAPSIPFSTVRFILYAQPVAVPVASYKDNPGWRELARQNARHRRRFCDILRVVAVPPATLRCLAGLFLAARASASKSRGRRWRLRDDSTMVLFGQPQPH